MKYVILTILATLISLVRANDLDEAPDFEVWKSESPDGNYFSAIRRMPDAEYVWQKDSDGLRLVVYPMEKQDGIESLGDLYFTFDKAARVPEDIEWTADSKYLVFSTTSTGGHSPWNSKTYVFSVVAKRVVCVDDVIGPIINAGFDLEGRHTATFRIAKAGEGAADKHPTPKKMDLSVLFSKNQKDIEQPGADQPATKPADKVPAKKKPSTKPSKAGPR